MRRLVLAALTTGLLVPSVLLSGSPASAHPAAPAVPALPTDATYKATSNVQYLGRFPEHAGTAGGARSADGKVFYLTDPRGVFTYDTSKPEAPVLLDAELFPQVGAQPTGPALAQEDPNTDGEVLLVEAASSRGSLGSVHVVDVRNPKDLKLHAVVPTSDHTWTCVSGLRDGRQVGCAYAYGRSGGIIDLTKPDKAELLKTTWRSAVNYGNSTNSPYTHDLTEIRPGLVLSAGSTNVLMDTSVPAAPVLLNKLEQPGRFPSLGYHSVEWARGGEDDFLVAGTEIAPSGANNSAGSDCKGPESVIETWDARAVKTALKAYAAGAPASVVRNAKFTKIDAFSVNGRGLFLNGAAPSHVLYCAHWMEQHPTFNNGGLMAVSYYDRGTRFVQVSSEGKMSEFGWIVAAEGYSGSPQWITDDIVYIMDYRRGLEVVRLKPEPATSVQAGQQDVIALGSLALASAEPARGSALPVAAAGLLALLMLNVGLLRRRARV